ncbi:MAG: dephospho-CoA kinase [Corallococcus sp.]|nr:dephospho-CoA kinase [Bacillota bacterium]MCM1533854.1 dephospho-CoA kinase [Corallococcus sp.]
MTNKVIAVTGGIGSGKSEVMRIIREQGYATVSCDVLAMEVAERNDTAERVRDLLGEEFVEGSKLNRTAIRDKVFSDKELLIRYNAIFFDEIKRLLTERLSELCGVVFVEIPVFDAFEFEWNAVWLVEAADELRINRAMLRDGSSKDTILKIADKQRICVEYTLKLTNNGSLDDLGEQVRRALKSV